MAGYIMTIGAGEYLSFFTKGTKPEREEMAKRKSMEECILRGVYSTYIEKPQTRTVTQADYFGIKEGDNIYFFYSRNIYGIGEIISIDGTSTFYNHPDGNLCPAVGAKDTHPFLCLFKAAPKFFKDGVDMDDVLNSNPSAFRKLRFFHQRSFIQLDDIENAALRSYIIQKHEQVLITNDESAFIDTSSANTTHNEIRKKYTSNPDDYKLDVLKVFKQGIKQISFPDRIESESYVEGLILDYVKKDNKHLGKWDFMARQYPASPFKPPEYIDNMDLFGYRYVKGYESDKIISKYIVIEIKSKEVDHNTGLQVMKYVDWVCKEFAHGDYSMIEAYIVGYSITDESFLTDNAFTRHYIESSKHKNRGIEVVTGTWHQIKYLSYKDILEDMRRKSTL